MKTTGLIILFFIGIIVLTFLGYAFSIAMGWATLPFHQALNRVNTAHDVIDQSVNAQNCLTWQDWFKTEEGNIQTLQTTEQNAQDQLDQFNKEFPDSSKWGDAQNQQYTVLSDNVTGAKNETTDAINTYNAKAKQENLAICKDGLPVYIQPFSQ